MLKQLKMVVHFQLMLKECYLFSVVPPGSPSRGGHVMVYVPHKLTELAHSFLFCSCIYFCLHVPFNCISFHKFSLLLSSSLISALLVLSTTYLFVKVSFIPDAVLWGWLGSKHQLTIYLYCSALWATTGLVLCIFPVSLLCCFVVAVVVVSSTFAFIFYFFIFFFFVVLFFAHCLSKDYYRKLD